MAEGLARLLPAMAARGEGGRILALPLAGAILLTRHRRCDPSRARLHHTLAPPRAMGCTCFRRPLTVDNLVCKRATHRSRPPPRFCYT